MLIQFSSLTKVYLNGSEDLMNTHFENLTEKDLLIIDGGAAALLIGAGAATHTAGIWLMGDSLSKAAKK